jgi:hypothetical protein
VPIHIAKWEDARGLPAGSLKWICCECRALNGPRSPHCEYCGKQRWWVLGIEERDARLLTLVIQGEGA